MSPQQDPMMKSRDTYLSLVMLAQADGFQLVPQDSAVLVDRAFFASASWCGRVFRIPVRPPVARAEFTYHKANPRTAAIDLFQYQLTVDSVRVKIYEASSFFAIFAPAESFPGHGGEKALQMVRMLLSVEGSPIFKPINNDPNGPSFSTDPSLTAPRIGDWKRRIDAVLQDQNLVIIVYKATYDDMMTLVSNPSQWFEELRQAK